ncbi:FeoB small GTPase domain-containing protein [Methanoculleus receptaculi]|uniref:FeoB small GTPase domain-containing protein n=1 Tax=Methanoculleus receptaculi TaxID=394967 RepID=UPI0038505148
MPGCPGKGRLCGSGFQSSSRLAVPVEKKTGRLSRNGYDIEVVDLPGTYSLTAYSADEIIARDFILEGNPDVVVQVVDATNMERNLYLTLQVAELGVPMVIALNLVDLARAQGDEIDHERLSASLGIPIFYDPGTGKPAVLWESWTQPRPNRYDGPVAILVSPYTIRNGRDCLVVRDEWGIWHRVDRPDAPSREHRSMKAAGSRWTATHPASAGWRRRCGCHSTGILWRGRWPGRTSTSLTRLTGSKLRQ